MESEELKVGEKESERVMLQIRMPDGITKNSLDDAALLRLESYLAGGQISKEHWDQGQVSLTLSGRLMADRIVREILM
jgi:oxygen-independent coproporphyrinogen-3 oxidase